MVEKIIDGIPIIIRDYIANFWPINIIFKPKPFSF